MRKQPGMGLQFQIATAKGDPRFNPTEPGNTRAVFIKNNYGVIVEAPLWLANLQVSEGKAIFSTQNEYLKSLGNQAKKVKPKVILHNSEEDRMDRLEKNLDRLTGLVADLVEQKKTRKKGKK